MYLLRFYTKFRYTFVYCSFIHFQFSFPKYAVKTNFNVSIEKMTFNKSYTICKKFREELEILRKVYDYVIEDAHKVEISIFNSDHV